MTTTTFAHPLVQVPIRTASGETAAHLTGERVAPGLVITPSFDEQGRFDDYWSLRHEASGADFGIAFDDLDLLRSAAEKIAAVGDWTVGKEQLSDEMKREAYGVLDHAQTLAWVRAVGGEPEGVRDGGSMSGPRLSRTADLRP